jgi:hypothetical protein
MVKWQKRFDKCHDEKEKLANALHLLEKRGKLSKSLQNPQVTENKPKNTLPNVPMPGSQLFNHNKRPIVTQPKLKAKKVVSNSKNPSDLKVYFENILEI